MPVPYNFITRAEGATRDCEPITSAATIRFLSAGLSPVAPLVGAMFEGITPAISGQIAVRLAVAYFTAITGKQDSAMMTGGAPTELVRESFRGANDEIFEYAHRMFSTGGVGAYGVVSMLWRGRFIAGRVGPMQGYLVRGEAITPLFLDGPVEAIDEEIPISRRYLGAGAKVLVDLVTVALRGGDSIVLVNRASTDELERAIALEMQREGARGDKTLAVVRAVRSVDEKGDEFTALGRQVLVSALSFGSDLIVLRDVVPSVGGTI